MLFLGTFKFKLLLWTGYYITFPITYFDTTNYNFFFPPWIVCLQVVFGCCSKANDGQGHTIISMPEVVVPEAVKG